MSRVIWTILSSVSISSVVSFFLNIYFDCFFLFLFLLKLSLSISFHILLSPSLSLSLFLSPSLFLFIALSATLIILFSIIIYNKTMSFSIKSYCYNIVTMILFISLSPWHHLPSVQSNCCNISIDKRSSSRALNNACDIRENACGRPEIEACVTKVVTTRCRSTKGV